MPNRILKESICTSESIDSLTEFQEVFFYRLLVNCDDFGRFFANPKILSSRLFPLRSVSTNQVDDAIDALVREGMITIYVVGGKEYVQVNAWKNHQQVRATKSKYPSPDDDEMKPFADECKQMISDDSKCPRNRNRESVFDNRESVSVIGMPDDEAHQIQREQDYVLTAAENAGFNKSPMSRAKIVELYAEHGKDKILNAISECVRYGVTNLAYLEAVLKGGPKKQKPKVVAQGYEQRDYTDIQDQFEKEQEARILQRLKEAEG